jgi:ubiquinone biosynthesis protein COQ9
LGRGAGGRFGAYIDRMSPENTPFPDPDAETRDRLADAVAANAPFDGWTATAISAAARGLGLPEGEAGRLFPGGPTGMLEYLSSRSDRRMVADLEAAGVDAMKVTERIRTAVRLRLEKHAGERDAARRALSLLAMPLNAGLALKLLYRTVDAMWYAAGDTSVDFNFYTKRATLAGVYSATLLFWLNDRSDNGEATWAFLDRRLGDVMKIEKLKSQIRAWPGARTRAGAMRR